MTVNFDFSTFQRTGDPQADLQTYMNATGKSEADAKADLQAQFGDPVKPSVFGNNTSSAASASSYENMSIGDILAQAGIENSDDILDEAGVDENLSIIDFLKGWINSLVGGKDDKEEKETETKETETNETKTNEASKSSSSNKNKESSSANTNNQTDKSKDVKGAVRDALASGNYTGSREEVINQLYRDLRAADPYGYVNRADVEAAADALAQR